MIIIAGAMCPNQSSRLAWETRVITWTTMFRFNARDDGDGLEVASHLTRLYKWR